jgi:hypothetical protein
MTLLVFLHDLAVNFDVNKNKFLLLILSSPRLLTCQTICGFMVQMCIDTNVVLGHLLISLTSSYCNF